MKPPTDITFRGPNDPWVWLSATLNWLYGADRTRLIFAGLDDRTNADLKAWHELGRKRT